MYYLSFLSFKIRAGNFLNRNKDLLYTRTEGCRAFKKNPKKSYVPELLELSNTVRCKAKKKDSLTVLNLHKFWNIEVITDLLHSWNYSSVCTTWIFRKKPKVFIISNLGTKCFTEYRIQLHPFLLNLPSVRRANCLAFGICSHTYSFAMSLP